MKKNKLRWRRLNEIEEGFVIPLPSFTTSWHSLATESTIPYLDGKYCYSVLLQLNINGDEIQ